MAMLMCALALLALAPAVSGQFVCPSGYTAKTGAPKCNGAVSSTCSASTCCDETKTCTDFSVAWLAAQLVAGGCMKDDAKQFWDLKKMSTTVAAPAGETEVKAACCTDLADATCADWTLLSCSAGKTKIADQTTAAAADTDGKTMSQAGYDATCCEDSSTAKTCSTFSAVWIGAALLRGGCFKDGAKQFFDMKKLATEVADPAGEAEVKAACCTDMSDATCADWMTLNSCSSGTKVLEPTTSCPADGDDGLSLKTDTYQSTCCKTPPPVPKTCASFTAAWVTASLLAGGCAKDGAKMFMDLKKTATSVAAPAAEADVKAACCTAFSAATCVDWNLMTCKSGTSRVAGTTSAPADTDGTKLSQDKFQSTCCGEPMKCSAWTKTVSVDGATSVFQRAPLAIVVLTMALAAMN